MDNIQAQIDFFLSKDKRNEESYLHFARLAAVPLLFSPDLLYKLWRNFKSFTNSEGKSNSIPYLVVSDLLLSNFCRPVGYQLYKMEEDVRLNLLKGLSKPQKMQVATFLEQYAIKSFSPAEKNIQNIHLKIAKLYLRPEEFINEIKDDLLSKEKNSLEKSYALNLYYQLKAQSGDINGLGLTLGLAKNEVKDVLEIERRFLRGTVFEQFEEIEKPKPQEIIGLEKKIGVEFFEFKEKSMHNCEYTTNDNNEVIYLFLTNSNVKELGFLTKFKYLEELTLDFNEIIDISPLKELKFLGALSLHFNKIRNFDFSIIEEMPQLEILGLFGNPIKNIPKDFLKTPGENCLPLLRKWLKNRNNIKPIQISEIEKLLSFEFELSHDNKNLKNNSYFLNQQGKVTHLSIRDTKLSDMSLLSDFSDLEYLDISFNRVVMFDFETLKSFNRLKELYLRGNSINNLPEKLFNIKGNCLSRIKEYFKKPQLILDLEVAILCEIKKADNIDSIEVSDSKSDYLYFTNEQGKITQLRLRNLSKPDITLLQKFTDIEVLELSDCEQLNLNSIVNLTKLNMLCLCHNEIKEIKFVKGLRNLKTLCLCHNQIKDISILENLTKLKDLDIGFNLISDISPIRKLVLLEELDVSSNDFIDYSVISNLICLEELELANNEISDTSFLEKLTSLKTLNLSTNLINSVSCIENLTNLKYLDLSANPIKVFDLSLINRLPDLEILNLSDALIENIPEAVFNIDYNCLIELKEWIAKNENSKPQQILNLEKKLNIAIIQTEKERNIWDIETTRSYMFDKRYNTVTHLNLSNCDLEDVSFLSEFKDLEVLNLNGNKISNVEEIGQLTKLRILNLENNRIEDIEPVSELYDLEELYLGNNQVESLIFLMVLKNLRIIELQNNKIFEIYFISGKEPRITSVFLFDNLDVLRLYNNPICKMKPEIFEQENCIKSLGAFDISNEWLVDYYIYEVDYNYEFVKEQLNEIFRQSQEFINLISSKNTEDLKKFIDRQKLLIKYWQRDFKEGIFVDINGLETLLALEKASSSERKMGAEVEYKAIFELIINGKQEKLIINLYEYPLRVANSLNLDSVGHKYIRNSKDDLLYQFQQWLDCNYIEEDLDIEFKPFSKPEEALDFFLVNPNTTRKGEIIDILLSDTVFFEKVMNIHLSGATLNNFAFADDYSFSIKKITNFKWFSDNNSIILTGEGIISIFLENAKNNKIEKAFDTETTFTGELYRNEEYNDWEFEGSFEFPNFREEGAGQYNYEIVQGYKYISYRNWDWWLHIEANEENLDKIENVTYFLHNTFKEPIIIVTERSSKFKLTTSGWGVFMVKVVLRLKDNSTIELKHYLQLGLPEGEFETPEQAIGVFLTNPKAQRDEEVKELIIKEKVFLTNIINDKLIEELKFKVAFSEFDLNLVTLGLKSIMFDKNLSLGYTNKDGELQIAGSGKINVLINNNEKDIKNSYLFSFDIKIIQDANYEWGLSENNINIIDVYSDVDAEETSFLEIALKDKITLDAKVVSYNNGGLILDIKGKEVFLPNSQIIADFQDENMLQYDYIQNYINKVIRVKIIEFNTAKENYIASSKAVFYAENSISIEDIKVGQELNGLVLKFFDYGVLIDLGNNIQGLVQVTDISWKRIKYPEEELIIAQKVKTIVTNINSTISKKYKIDLSIKQLIPNTFWDNLSENVKEGSIVKGKIVEIEDSRVFMEVRPGVEGQVHVSEITWSNQPINTREYFKLDQEYDAKVVTIDRQSYKMSLSLKQLLKDPWTDIENSYQIGTRVTGEVKTITQYGVFVELREGIGGMIHISDLSWTKRYSPLSEYITVGQSIDVLIMEINPQERKLSLGHKQLEENPWDSFEAIFPVGSYHTATIARRDDKGGIVALPGLEAFAPKNHLKKEDGKFAEAGEELIFKVIEFNRDDKRILVSHTRFLEDFKKSGDSILKPSETVSAPFDYDKAMHFFTQNNTDAIFDLIKQHATKTSNKTATSTAILLQAEYNELKRNELMGVLSYQEVSLKRNQLNVRLLDFLGGL